MAMVTGAKRRRGPEEEEEEEDEDCLDRISCLPDGVLGDIVSLLPTKDGARTQVLSSRWRNIWRSAPLNVSVDPSLHAPFGFNHVSPSLISRILSSHRGPGRRFSIPAHYFSNRGLVTATSSPSLNGWLESPALDGLQELEFHYQTSGWDLPPPPLPKSLHRFSSTLCVASFGCCSFLNGNDASRLQFPVLRQLSLSDVRFSESSLGALLAACPVLQSLLLTASIGFSRVQIACPTLRSIGVRTGYGWNRLQQLIIEDAPCLERLLCFDSKGMGITISVISAPKLHVLGEQAEPMPEGFVRLIPQLSANSTIFEFGSTVFQGSGFANLKMVVHSVKILSLKQDDLSLDVVIDFMKCFPYLEKLFIQTKMAGEKNLWRHKYKNLIGTLDIHLKKIVLTGYRGNTSHANFAKFFVLNARMLESMKLECFSTPSSAWIDKQHRLLQIKKKASRVMQLEFVSYGCLLPYSCFCPEQVHDLSTADPFPCQG